MKQTNWTDTPPRLAILSDLHLDSDVAGRGTCRRCGDLLSVTRQGEVARCRCGRSSVTAGDQYGFRADGDIRAVANHLPWGQMARAAGVDMVLVTGDVCSGAAAVEWVAREFHGLPVVLLAGNREFYGGDRTQRLAELRRAAAATDNVAFLECDVSLLDIRGWSVRILGATLWTDFALLECEGISVRDALDHEERRNLLRHRDPLQRMTVDGKPFTAECMRQVHLDTRAWLEQELARPFEGITVVATHHAPVPENAAVQFNGTPTNAAFYSDLSSLISTYRPSLVTWGHTHAPDIDVTRDGTRFLSRQRGYTWEADPLFGPAIVDLEV